MDCHDAVRVVLKWGVTETHIVYHGKQLLLSEESLNALHKILVRMFVPCDVVTKGRDHVEGIGFVELLQDLVLHFAEL